MAKENLTLEGKLLNIDGVETRGSVVTTTLSVRERRKSRQVEFSGIILPDSIGKRIQIYEKDGRCVRIVDMGNSRTYVSDTKQQERRPTEYRGEETSAWEHHGPNSGQRLF